MFGDKIQTEEDLLIAFGLVVWLRWFNKTALAFINKDENAKISVIKIEKEKWEIYKKWEEIVHQRIIKLEKKYLPNLKWLTPVELNHQMKQLKVEIKHKLSDDLLWSKWRITNELLEKFKQEILKRQKEELNPQTWNNVYKWITELDWHIWEVLDIAKSAKTGLDFLKSMIELFSKKWKLPSEKEVGKYIDIYIKAKVEIIENKPENKAMKKKVSEQAKKNLKEKMMKEYEELTKTINKVNEKWWSVEEKFVALREKLINHVEYKEVVKMIDGYLRKTRKENKSPSL